MSAVLTKFHGPTNHRPTRISVKWSTAPELLKIYNYDYELSATNNHLTAFREWCEYHGIHYPDWAFTDFRGGMVFVPTAITTSRLPVAITPPVIPDEF